MSTSDSQKRHYPTGLEHHRFKHGGRSRYMHVVREQLREKIELLEDHDPYSLHDEETLLRALLMETLEREQERGEKSGDEYTAQIDLIERISRVVERMTRMRNDTAITAAEVGLITSRFADILLRYVPEENQEKAIKELFGVVPLQQNALPAGSE